MFGMSFGELAVLVIVALVVMGPKELPKVLRKLGQWSAKLRRMAMDLRAQSGIDDVLNEGSLASDIAEIRKLARGEIDGVVRAASIGPLSSFGDSEARAANPEARASHDAPLVPDVVPSDMHWVARDREWPREGADSYGALPDTAVVYADTFPLSALANDPLYAHGTASTGTVAELGDAAHEDHVEPDDDLSASSASVSA